MLKLQSLVSAGSAVFTAIACQRWGHLSELQGISNGQTEGGKVLNVIGRQHTHETDTCSTQALLLQGKKARTGDVAAQQLKDQNANPTCFICRVTARLQFRYISNQTVVHRRRSGCRLYKCFIKLKDLNKGVRYITYIKIITQK